MTDAATKDVSPRKDPRPNGPRDAAARAAELRSHGALDDDGTDKFHVEPGMVPDGWAYEWKRNTVYGKEDPSYNVSLARQGWEAVPADRHPSYMPKDGSYSVIERDGLVLMERPLEIVEEARDMEVKKARTQMRQQDALIGATPEGTLPRDADPRTKPRVKRSYGPPDALPVPD